jgi:hypothetical protein
MAIAQPQPMTTAGVRQDVGRAVDEIVVMGISSVGPNATARTLAWRQAP